MAEYERQRVAIEDERKKIAIEKRKRKAIEFENEKLRLAIWKEFHKDFKTLQADP